MTGVCFLGAREHHHVCHEDAKFDAKKRLHHNRLLYHGTHDGIEKEKAGEQARAYIMSLIDKVVGINGLLVAKTRQDQKYAFTAQELAIWATGAGWDGQKFEEYVNAKRGRSKE